MHPGSPQPLLTGYWYFQAISVRSRPVMPTVNSSLFEALLVHVWSNITHANCKGGTLQLRPWAEMKFLATIRGFPKLGVPFLGSP